MLYPGAFSRGMPICRSCEFAYGDDSDERCEVCGRKYAAGLIDHAADGEACCPECCRKLEKARGSALEAADSKGKGVGMRTEREPGAVSRLLRKIVLG